MPPIAFLPRSRFSPRSTASRSRVRAKIERVDTVHRRLRSFLYPNLHRPHSREENVVDDLSVGGVVVEKAPTESEAPAAARPRRSGAAPSLRSPAGPRCSSGRSAPPTSRAPAVSYVRRVSEYRRRSTKKVGRRDVFFLQNRRHGLAGEVHERQRFDQKHGRLTEGNPRRPSPGRAGCRA